MSARSGSGGFSVPKAVMRLVATCATPISAALPNDWLAKRRLIEPTYRRRLRTDRLLRAHLAKREVARAHHLTAVRLRPFNHDQWGVLPRGRPHVLLAAPCNSYLRSTVHTIIVVLIDGGAVVRAPRSAEFIGQSFRAQAASQQLPWHPPRRRSGPLRTPVGPVHAPQCGGILETHAVHAPACEEAGWQLLVWRNPPKQ